MARAKLIEFKTRVGHPLPQRSHLNELSGHRLCDRRRSGLAEQRFHPLSDIFDSIINGIYADERK